MFKAPTNFLDTYQNFWDPYFYLEGETLVYDYSR